MAMHSASSYSQYAQEESAFYAESNLYPYLSPYERSEIGSYPHVYYYGQKLGIQGKHIAFAQAPSYTASSSSSSQQNQDTSIQAAGTNNYGYDDERGDYQVRIGDHIAYRYEIVSVLGKGSFGQVVKCLDHRTGRTVALKLIRNKKRFHQQALVETKLLNLIRTEQEKYRAAGITEPGLEAIVEMYDCFSFRSHLCITFELLDMNLYEFIKLNQFRGFHIELIQDICHQLLDCLCFLHSHRIVHCDLKPENVLLRTPPPAPSLNDYALPKRLSVKMIDFGSSCFDNERVYTYIQSRFYRSPEVILGYEYGSPIDMWSLGCILCELYTGYPIFPGENEHEQLLCMMEVLGSPSANMLERCSRRKVFFHSNMQVRLVPNSKGRIRKVGSKSIEIALRKRANPASTLDESSKQSYVLFVDFIRRCLIWDPRQRMNPIDAAQHPFLTGDLVRWRSMTQSGPPGLTAGIKSLFGINQTSSSHSLGTAARKTRSEAVTNHHGGSSMTPSSTSGKVTSPRVYSERRTQPVYYRPERTSGSNGTKRQQEYDVVDLGPSSQSEYSRRFSQNDSGSRKSDDGVSLKGLMTGISRLFGFGQNNNDARESSYQTLQSNKRPDYLSPKRS